MKGRGYPAQRSGLRNESEIDGVVAGSFRKGSICRCECEEDALTTGIQTFEQRWSVHR